MTSRRDRVLQATAEATRILDQFPVEHRTSFDVIRAVSQLGYPIVFRPTTKLLGATISFGDVGPGIIITTNRSLATQRFTLAHELGHLVLGHKLENEMLTKEMDALVPTDSWSPGEAAAHGFASELLGHRKLISAIASKRGWEHSQITDPAIVYQLALRLGLSFQATCWALARHRLIAEQVAAHMASTTSLKKIKGGLIGRYQSEDPWADAWQVTPGDAGATLECGPNDVFAVPVEENASSGYIWEIEKGGSSFEILEENAKFPKTYGGDSTRVLLLRSKATGTLNLTLEHRRPWNRQRLSIRVFAMENSGKEEEGFPRYVKRTMLEGGHAHV